MVVKVRLENGRETWLDPTNPETIKAVENQYGSKVVLIDGKAQVEQAKQGAKTTSKKKFIGVPEIPGYVFHWFEQKAQYDGSKPKIIKYADRNKPLPKEKLKVKQAEGIEYFKGEMSNNRWVDALLYKNKYGQIIGILNHYPFDFPPYEKKGNINVMVAPKEQGKGIGLKLVKEALNRYPDIDLYQQEWTPQGQSLLKQIGADKNYFKFFQEYDKEKDGNVEKYTKKMTYLGVDKETNDNSIYDYKKDEIQIFTKYNNLKQLWYISGTQLMKCKTLMDFTKSLKKRGTGMTDEPKAEKGTEKAKKGVKIGENGGFIKDDQGNYKNSQGYELINQFDGTYQVLDKNGMDISGEYETLQQAKQTIEDFELFENQDQTMNTGGRFDKVVFKNKNRPKVVIEVLKTTNGRIVEINNQFKVKFPYKVGQTLDMGHQTWACSNGFFVNDQNTCAEKKIFGIKPSDIPQGHELRMLYPNKFRKKNGGLTMKTGSVSNEPLYNVVEKTPHATKVSATPDMYSNLTKQGVIDLSNTMSYYERMDNDEPEITTFENAKKVIELEGDWKVVKIAKHGTGTETSEVRFLSKDHSGRGERPYILNESHIRKTWDLKEVGDDDETSLGDFLDNSEPGDKWQSGTESLENLGIGMSLGGSLGGYTLKKYTKEQQQLLKELEQKFRMEEPGTKERMEILQQMHNVQRMEHGGRISFDRDSSSFWVDNVKGSGQLSFETWDEANKYLSDQGEIPEKEYHPTLYFNDHVATKEEIAEAFKNWGKKKTGGTFETEQEPGKYIFKDTEKAMLKNAFLFLKNATETDDYFVIELSHDGNEYLLDWFALDGSDEGSVGYFKHYHNALKKFNEIREYIKGNWDIVAEKIDVPYEKNESNGEIHYDAPDVMELIGKASKGFKFQPWLYGKRGIKIGSIESWYGRKFNASSLKAKRGTKFGVNKKYTHFAVNKATGKIVNGFETISDIESLKYYAKSDLKDMDLNPNDYKILSKAHLLRMGVDPFNWDNWQKNEPTQAKRGAKTDNSVQLIEYKGEEIMFEPINKEYFVNDNQFKTLAEAKKYIDSGSPLSDAQINLYRHGAMKQGGKLKPYPDLSRKEPMVIKDDLFDTFTPEKPTLIKEKKSKKDTGTLTNIIPQVELVRMGVQTLENIGDRKITDSKSATKILYKVFPKNQIGVQEFYYALYTDRANNVIAYYNVSKGGVSGTIADAELVGSVGVKLLAQGVLVAHNHPSGNLKPSEADIKMALHTRQVLKTLDITLLDSIIIVPGGEPVDKFEPYKYYSLQDEGKI